VVDVGWGLSTRLSIRQKVSANDADDLGELSSELDSLARLNSEVQELGIRQRYELRKQG
jgi:hypothetical protein